MVVYAAAKELEKAIQGGGDRTGTVKAAKCILCARITIEQLLMMITHIRCDC